MNWRVCLAIFWLLGWLLAPQSVALAGKPVSAPTSPDRRHSSDLVPADSGVVIEVQDQKPTGMSGPRIPGEVNFQGSLVPGLLSEAQRRSIERTFPGFIRDAVREPPVSLSGIRLIVMLDPGHGGKQTGATGVSGLKEKKLVLDVAHQVRKVLAELPHVQVVMTRKTDEEVSLWERVNMANQVGADVFISIHANAFPSSSLEGIETFFHSIEASGEEAKRVARYENASGGEDPKATPDTLSFILQDIQQAERLRDSSRLAHLVQEQLAQAVPFENRGVMQADFVVLRGTRMPSILLELGFLTHPGNEKMLKKPATHRKLAEAIRRGLLAYWEVIKHKQGGKSKEVGTR